MYIEKTELVTKLAYMIGVRDDYLEEYYGEENAELIEQLKENRAATIIRFLNKLRTRLMQNFARTNDLIKYELKNLDRIEFYDKDEIKQLENWGINIIKANYKAESYLSDVSKYINENIDACSDLFYDWQNWNYIKDLFKVPKCSDPSVMKSESVRYQNAISLYPFNMYIHWNPHDCRNLLHNDTGFLKELFEMHGDEFVHISNTTDAHENTKQNIYDFINDGDSTIIVVDCENSDCFKLASVLKNLEDDEIEKVKKILLYDDYHTTLAWDWLSKYTHIPVEHVEVNRVKDDKSQVDIAMSVGICKEYYRNSVDSFILFSSDCDYWALIDSLKDARFLVMYENEKCSNATLDKLYENKYEYCSIDDFCSGNTEDFRKLVMFKTFLSKLPDLSGLNAKTLLTETYGNVWLDPSKQEFHNFYNKYVKTLKLVIDEDGNMSFEIQK